MVIEENHAFEQIIGSPAAPYINALAARGALMTNSFATMHPSEPNYLELFSGSNQGVTDDSCPHKFTAPNLASELITKHRSFGGFSEALPAPGYLGCSAPGGYVRRHNPWSDFTNAPPSENLPFLNFPTDYTRLPTVSYVVPNLNDDMHDGTVQQADSWLSNHLASYVRWAASHNSLLVVTWDEDDRMHGNHIATLFVGPMVRPGRYGEFITQDNILRTIEAVYGLPFAAKTAQVHAITDIWRPGAVTTLSETFASAPHITLMPESTSKNSVHSKLDSSPTTLQMTRYYLDPQVIDGHWSSQHGEPPHTYVLTRAARFGNSLRGHILSLRGLEGFVLMV
jgi:acid phosphatase